MTRGLARSLTTADAVVIGIGSMVGAGVFVVFSQAAASAGTWLLAGLAVAGAVAFANATSSAQLAAQYPTSGGTYVYGRERLGEWAGYAAGWSFVIGKTASLAAMALTFATYTTPEPFRRPVAAAAVVALAAVNYRGVTRTARLTRVLVVVTVLALAVGLVSLRAPDGAAAALPAQFPGVPAIGEAAALLFFAFAGYARIATMGEEVRDPRRAIPRAIVAALVLVLALYTLVAVRLLTTLGPGTLAAVADPFVVGTAHAPWATAIVRVGAATASLGALLGLVAGVGRTVLAMARHGDLPAGLAAVHPRFATPHRAEVAVAAVVVALVLTVDLRGAIGFSSFGVLLYYAVANAAALTQGSAHRRYPRWLQVAGVAGCLLLALAVPVSSLLAGAGVLVAGLAGRALVRAVRGR